MQYDLGLRNATSNASPDETPVLISSDRPYIIMADESSNGKTYFEQQRELLVGDVAAVSDPIQEDTALTQSD